MASRKKRNIKEKGKSQIINGKIYFGLGKRKRIKQKGRGVFGNFFSGVYRTMKAYRKALQK